jgi:eukaryotic-like serine/threonine-protein kinase
VLLRREVEQLLSADAHSGRWLDQPNHLPLTVPDQPSPPLLAPGQMVAGRFEVLACVGQGGMGQVYRARDRKLHRTVALKVLHPGLAHSPEQQQRLEREARAISRLHHPHICTLYDLGQEGARSYLVMEYVEGESLADRLKQGSVSPADVVSWGMQMADALEHAHRQGVIHRDLKPGNILLTTSGVKLLDFGIAKLQEARAVDDVTTSLVSGPATVEGTILGTVAYMSPEQVERKPLDARSDVFSLGSVLYELLTGNQAFAGETGIAVLASILHQEPAPMATQAAHVPDSLAQVVTRCLRKDPQQRFPSMAELREALRECVAADRPTQALQLSPEHAHQLPVVSVPQRHRIPRPLLLLAAALILIFAGSGLWTARRHPAGDTIRSLAILPLKPLTIHPSESDQALGLALSDALITRLGVSEQVLVRPTSAVRQYTNPHQDLVTAGQQLQVDSVLDGSFQRSADRIRITMQLVRTRDGKHLWTKQLEEKFTNLFAAEDTIAGQVAETLMLRLTLAQRQVLAQPRSTTTPEVYELMGRGRFHIFRVSPDGAQKAVQAFEQAVAQDSTYAPAYAGLVSAYIQHTGLAMTPYQEMWPKAKAAVQKALALDDNLAEAHMARGAVQFLCDWDWTGAEHSFQRALALNPNNTDAYLFYGNYLDAVGRAEEAIQMKKRALARDPFSPLPHLALAQSYFNDRRYEEGAQWARKAIDLDPNHIIGRQMLAGIYYKQGHYDEYAAEALRSSELFGTKPKYVAAMQQAYAVAGVKGLIRKSSELLAVFQKERRIAPVSLAIMYAELEDRDRAFVFLEQACEDRDAMLVYLKVSPVWDNLRADPRFDALLRRIGLNESRVQKNHLGWP